MMSNIIRKIYFTRKNVIIFVIICSLSEKNLITEIIKM